MYSSVYNSFYSNIENGEILHLESSWNLILCCRCCSNGMLSMLQIKYIWKTFRGYNNWFTINYFKQVGVENISFKSNQFKGMMCLVGNTLAMSVYYILQKPVLKKYPPISVTGWAYIVGTFSY